MEWVKRWGVIIVPGIVGLVILMYGLWEVIKPREPVVEIIKNEKSEAVDVVVDVSGAVEKPGVYKLERGARIGDALVAAGGLAAIANREWVAQNLNLAEAVKDGGKIFIPPRADENNQISNSNNQINSNNQNSKLININTASQEELETLWGIGEARAKMVIASRPYGAKEELISKAKIPQSVYDKISPQITVY